MLLNGNSEVYCDEEKGKLIADHFESSHSLTQNIRQPNTIDKTVRKCLNELDRKLIRNIENNLVQIEEVIFFIKKLKNSKAPGFDELPNILLKHLPVNALQNLTDIYNACLSIGYFPDFFKKAKTIAIPKPNKDPRRPSSYRPISLLNAMDKIFEKIILFRLNQYIEENEIIMKEQFGFRKGHSTIHQVKRITNMVQEQKDK